MEWKAVKLLSARMYVTIDSTLLSVVKCNNLV